MQPVACLKAISLPKPRQFQAGSFTPGVEQPGIGHARQLSFLTTNSRPWQPETTSQFVLSTTRLQGRQNQELDRKSHSMHIGVPLSQKLATLMQKLGQHSNILN